VAGRVALVLALCVAALLQYDHLAKSYPDYNRLFRNRIDLIPTCIHEVPEFAEVMRARYGTRSRIIERVFTSPRLNGSDRGIKIATLTNMDILRGVMFARDGRVLDSDLITQIILERKGGIDAPGP
jgi:hypothetical protein